MLNMMTLTETTLNLMKRKRNHQIVITDLVAAQSIQTLIVLMKVSIQEAKWTKANVGIIERELMIRKDKRT